MEEDERLYPIALYSRKILVAKINYEICDKKFLSIIDSFQEWHHFLEGTSHEVTIYRLQEYFVYARVFK